MNVPPLFFTPYAWAKLLAMRDFGDTEVGGWGISSREDPLLITDFYLVKQECSSSLCEMDDEGLVDYMENMVDKGLEPAEFMRIWIHTHPGNSPSPSGQDETTFKEQFAETDWGIMFIVANGGQTYARLRVNKPVATATELKIGVDWTAEFPSADRVAWKEEYDANVSRRTFQVVKQHGSDLGSWQGLGSGTAGAAAENIRLWDELAEQQAERYAAQQRRHVTQLNNSEEPTDEELIEEAVRQSEEAQSQGQAYDPDEGVIDLANDHDTYNPYFSYSVEQLAFAYRQAQLAQDGDTLVDLHQAFNLLNADDKSSFWTALQASQIDITA